MKELCEYVLNKRKARKHQHQAVIRINGSCSGLTNREYKSVKHSQKSSFPKQYKAAYSKIWRGNNEKYDLKTFKL
jgi:hypothetical protein